MDDTQRLDYNDDEEETTLNRDRPAGNLHMFAGIHGPAQDFPIYYGQNIIGRHASCDITLPAQSVSKKHAILQVRGDCHTICDKGSLNKTRRGKVALAPDVHYALSDGDFLLFADVACRYTVLDKVEAETTGVEESEDDSVLIPPTQGALAIEKTPGAAIRRIARGAVLARDSGDEDEEEERPTRRHEGGCGSFKDSFKTSSTGAIFPPDADTIVPESDEEIDTSTSETHLPTLNPPSDSDTDTSRRSSFVPCSQNISTPVVLKEKSKLIGRTLPVVDKEEMESGKPSDAEIKLRLAEEDPPDCKKNQEETVESTSGGIVPAPHVELVGTIDDNVKKEQECEKLVQDDASNKPSSEGIPVSSVCGEDDNVASSRSETIQEAPSESKPKIDASMQHNNVQLSDTGVKPKEDNVTSEMESDISEDATKSGIDVKTAETSEVQSNRTEEDSNGGALGSGGAEFHMDSDTDDDEDEAATTGPHLEKAETHHVPEMKESENNETSVTGGNEGGSDSDTDVEDDLNVIKSKSDDEGNKTKDEPSKSEGSAGFGIDSDTDDDDDDDDVVDIPKPAESNAEQDSKGNTEEKKEEFHMDSDTDVEEDVSTADVKETEPESSKESGKETKDVLNLDRDTDVDEEVDVSSRDVTHGPQDSSASTNVKEATGGDSDTDVDEDDQIPGGSNVALEKTSTDEPKALAKEASALHVDSDTDVDDDDVAPEGTTHADSAKTGSDVTKAAELHLDSDTDVEEGDAGEVDRSVLENAGEDQKSLSSTNETGAVDEISNEQTKNLPAQLGTEDDETQKSESESIDLEMMPTQCFLEPQEEESELQDEEEATQAFILSSTWAEPDPFKRPADPIGVLQISSVTLNTSEEEIDENAIAETQAFCSEAEPRGPSLQETPEPVERSVEETVLSSGSGEDSEKEGQQLPHEPISQDATQPVSQCLSGRPPQETGSWVHLKREVPASVWIRDIQQEGDSKDLEGDKETAEDETQAYEQSLNLELEATQSYIDCPSLQRSPLQTDTPAVPTAEEDNAEPDVPSEKIEQPSSEDTQASESDATQPYSPSHTGPGVDSGTTQSTGDSATQAESIHPVATEDDETQVVPQSVPAAEEVVPETSNKSKEKISLRRGLSRSKKKEEPARNIPTSSTVEEKTSSTVEEKASSTVEEKASSTTEEKTSLIIKEHTSLIMEEQTTSTAEEKTSLIMEEQTSLITEEQTSSTTEEQTSLIMEEQTSSTTEEKASLITEEQTSSITEEKASLITEEQTSLITEEQTSLITEEQTSSPTEEKTSLIMEEQTSSITEEQTSSPTEEKTSLITEEKASSTTEKQNSLINNEQTTLITEEKTSLITEEKISLITEQKTSLITEEKTSTEEPLDKGSAAPGSLKEGQDHQSTGKSQPSEPEIKEEQDQKEVRRPGGRRTAASQDKDTAKEEVPVAATSRKKTSKISSEAEPSTSGVSEKRGRKQVPRKGAIKEVNEELEEEHKQSSSNVEEIKESSAPEIISINSTAEIESASSVDDKSNTVQISKDSSDQASLENKESLCTESEKPMEAKENSAEKEPDSGQNKKAARNKRRVATRLKNETDKEEDKEENIDHNLKTSQEKDTSKQTSPLQTQQEESQGRKATRKSHVKPSDAAEENKKTVEDSQASQVSGNEKSRTTRRSLKEDVKEESEKVHKVKGKTRSTSVEDAGLKHEEKGNEDMPESDKRPKRTRKNSKKDTTKPEVKEDGKKVTTKPEEVKEDGKKVTTKPEEVKEDGKTEENESVTKPTRARKNIKEQQKPEDNIEPQETASSDSQTSRRTRRECREEDKVVQEETVKETTSRRTRRHSKEEEAVKSEDQTKKPRRTRKDSKEETTTKETVEESRLDNKKEAAEGKATLKTRKNVKDDEASVNETKQTEKNSKSERSSRTRAKASDESKELNEDVNDVNKGAEESPNASLQEETSKPARGRGRRAAKKEDISPVSTPVASRKRAKASDESKELNEDVEDINKGAETSPKMFPQEETSKPSRGRGRRAAKKEDISPVSTPVASRKRAKASDESKELNEDVEDVNKAAEESPKVSPQEETSKPAGGRGRRAAKKEDLSPVSTPVASRKRGQATKAEVEVKRKKSDEGEDQEETKAVETPKRGRGRPRKQDTQQTPTRKDVAPSDPSPSQNTRQRPSSALGNSPEPITPRRTNRVSTPTPATRLAQSASAPKILFTGVVDTAGEETIRSLGGDIAKSVFDCTHLVTDRVRRTVKFLCALARGIPIVTLDWIDKCKKSGCFLSPTGFLVHDKEQEKNFNFLLSESLQKAKRSPLFEGYEIHVTANVKPEPDQMKDIISCSGATFLPKMPRTFKEKCVIVSCPEDTARCKSVPASVPITSAEFILSGILRQEVNPTAYLLSPADTVPTPAKRKR